MQRLVYWIFISVLIFAPLAFGTVERWSLTIMESVSLSALLLFFLSVFRKKSTFYEVPGLIPLIFLGAYILLQLIPLPANLVNLISPATYTLYNDTVGIINPLGWISFSINPGATLSEFFRFSAYLAFYILTVQLLTKRDLLKQTIGVVIVFATLLSVLAMIQHFTMIQSVSQADLKIFWFRELTHGGAPFGPYVNRNHYAGWMGMIFPIVLSMFLLHKPVGIYRSFREKMIGFLTQDRTNTYILLGLSATLISVSIFLSLSRGGIISLGLALLFLAIMVTLGKPGRGKGVLIICVFTIVLLCVGWFGWEPIFKRFDTIRDVHGDIAGQRLTIWEDSFNLVKDFPLTGSGFGTFKDLYPKYRHFPGHMVVEHAHNDYLELLAEGGIPGTLLVFWFLAVFFFKSVPAFLKRNDMYSIYLYFGILAGIISILIHGLTDFNLHIGANGLYFFFLLGLAVSATNTRISYQQKDTNLNQLQFPLQKFLGPGFAIVFLFMLLFNTGSLMAELNFSSIEDVSLNKDIPPKMLFEINRRARRACRLNPLEAKYHFAAANIEAFRSNDDIALKQYIEAVRLNPARGEYLQRLAVELSARENFEAADKLLRAGIKYNPGNPNRYLGYAAWLLSQGHTQRAMKNLNRAIAMEPKKFDESLTLMVIHGLTEQEMQTAIPERVEPHLRFADFLLQTGNVEMAEAVYRHALEFVKNEDVVKFAYFNKVYQFYIKKDRPEDALDVLKEAIEFLPANPYLRLQMAALYEQLGVTCRAVEEYRNTLTIEPQNRKAKKRLKKILSE
ncbi:MAG: O-antigen ligase family protein [Thermodesulfobacteriota bacterium]|nr:O-antigen ligase family protein [Thermodesulfobacteriota bacterium]